MISGIELATNKKSLSLQLFVDWITGWTGMNDTAQESTKIAHVLFAGTKRTYSYMTIYVRI